MPSSTFSSRTLWNIGWRYLLRHPWQSVLMIVGIALGVAVIVAIDIANAGASRAFDLSTEAVTGRATHQIIGGPQGLDETIYIRLRREGIVQAAAPIVAEYVSSPQLGERPLQLLGVDAFAEAPFRSYLGQATNSSPEGLAAFLTGPGAVLISSGVAQRYKLAAGSPITLEIGGYERSAFIAGLLQPANDLSQRALDDLILADIATAQELTDRIGKLDRIDLILPEGSTAAEQINRINARLPQGTRVTPLSARSGTLEQMTEAFRINLTALSMLALVVGLFLIYNTMTFSVVQRRPLFGTLRCLGVTQREVFALVVSEAFIVGTIGAGLGLALGVVLGQQAMRMVTQTINDLYFVLNVRSVEIPIASLIKGALVGIMATMLTAAPPAWEAASVPPRVALSRSRLETKARRAVNLVALGGVGLLITGTLTLALPTRSLITSFAGTFAVTVGFAMLTPLATSLLMRSAAPPFGRAWGVLGRMAPRNVVNALSRTSIAIAALMVAVSVTIGVSLMINSFRYTVIIWLEQTLQGDIYISPPSPTVTQSQGELNPAAVQTIEQWPGVARVDTLRSVDVDSPVGPIHVAATHNRTLGSERLFLSVDRAPQAIWAAMQNDAVLISEPLANRIGLAQPGSAFTLYTDKGARDFAIIGIYYDYTSSQGTVLMSLETYRRYWDDPALTALALRLEPGADSDTLARDLQDALAPTQRLIVRPNRSLRQEVLTIFDRTFAITGALQLLATIVAFIGVLSALLSLQLEKQRELGILRAVGLTARQLWALVTLETSLMGAVAGVLAMPTGYALSYILIYIINRRAFGWTLQMRIEPAPFIQALLVAILAALLAGIYPAYKMGKMITANALKSE